MLYSSTFLWMVTGEGRIIIGGGLGGGRSNGCRWTITFLLLHGGGFGGGRSGACCSWIAHGGGSGGGRSSVYRWKFMDGGGSGGGRSRHYSWKFLAGGGFGGGRSSLFMELSNVILSHCSSFFLLSSTTANRWSCPWFVLILCASSSFSF